ncbi:MAG: hypothetical protein J0J01_11575 [Reyranella sp.]|uniref:hypothetical protein n=1 Tax=Reyranella sp. TaxID=1929291 RepID=UPI001AC2F702|nr:hypothetical protein [Reyranella sp.]MBN9087539.1 hypothetical protein [Reyranella sp.]
MQARSISVEERAVLQELESSGPNRAFNRRVTGRLNLYGLINEGPGGWFITEAGRKMLRTGRAVPLSPEQMMFSLGPVLATAENMAWVDGAECLAAA